MFWTFHYDKYSRLITSSRRGIAFGQMFSLFVSSFVCFSFSKITWKLSQLPSWNLQIRSATTVRLVILRQVGQNQDRCAKKSEWLVLYGYDTYGLYTIKMINSQLVHWPMVHRIAVSELSKFLFAVPNVTSPPSEASVPDVALFHIGPLLCCLKS